MVQIVRLPGGTFLHLMDLPLLVPEDDGPGFYAAGGSWRPGWTGAILHRSTDGGTNYDRVAELVDNAVQGTAQSGLWAGARAELWDEVSIVTVSLLNQADTLETVTKDAILGGANAAVIGDEVVQFRNAELVGPATYKLTGFLRGRKGTEDRIAAATGNVRFVMLTTGDVVRVRETLADIGQPRQWKAVSFGETLTATPAVTFTDTGRSVKPYAVAHLRGARNAGGDLAVSWVRRTRLDGAWLASVDVPLGEEFEAYQVEVLTGAGAVKRTIESTAPGVTYTAVDQAADFGSAQGTVRVRVYQMSARVGRGLPAEKIL